MSMRDFSIYEEEGGKISSEDFAEQAMLVYEKFLEGKIELDKNGYIITKNKSSITNISGVFAAGDVQDNKYQQAIVAAGSGAIAALDVEDYLIKNK